MKEIQAKVSAVIPTEPDHICASLADYRTGHSAGLLKRFTNTTTSRSSPGLHGSFGAKLNVESMRRIYRKELALPAEAAKNRDE